MRGEGGAHFTQGEFPGSGAKHERQHARQKVSNLAKSNFAVAFNFKFTLLGPSLPRIFAPQVLCLGNSKSEKGKTCESNEGHNFCPRNLSKHVRHFFMSRKYEPQCDKETMCWMISYAIFLRNGLSSLAKVDCTPFIAKREGRSAFALL